MSTSTMNRRRWRPFAFAAVVGAAVLASASPSSPAWCISSAWEDRPAFAPGTTVSGVPALVIHGEYDTGLPEARVLPARRRRPRCRARHHRLRRASWWWSLCGPELIDQFIEARRVVDASCADEPAFAPWMPGSFPVRVSEAPLAIQVGGPPANVATRRLATAVAWTAMDGLKHNFVSPDDSAGLRGGVVDWDPIEEPDFFSRGGSSRTSASPRTSQPAARSAGSRT